MKTFWDKVSCIYDIAEIVNKRTNGGIKSAVKAEIKQGMRVLDCAAGTGMISLAAAENAKHVTCTDFSKPMLMTAMKKARKNHVYNISFARRDICALRDEDNKYDAVIAGNVLHLLEEPEAAFSELVRVTKPGGKIIIPTYLQGDKSFLFAFFIRIYEMLGFSHKSDFTLDSYMEFIAENAEANGCAEYSTRLIPGMMSAGFAVIRK